MRDGMAISGLRSIMSEVAFGRSFASRGGVTVTPPDPGAGAAVMQGYENVGVSLTPSEAAMMQGYENVIAPDSAPVATVSESPQGDWVGNFGADGYALLAFGGTTTDEVSLPAGVTLTRVAVTGHRYASFTTDVRALETPDEASRRAAVWYHNTAMVGRLNFTDAYDGVCSLYCIDWDATTRRQIVEIDDGTHQTSYTIDSTFSAGLWISVPVSVGAGGQIEFTATLTDGPNALASGVFLDPA